MAKAKDPAEQEKKKQDAFERLPIPRSLAYFIVPTVLSQIAALLLNLADSFFVGRTGDPYQVAAMTLTFPVYVTMTVIAAIMGVGGNANIAASLGLRDRDRAKRYSVFCIYTAIGVVIIFACVVTGFRTPILTALGASRETMQFCKDYLFWTVLVGSIPLTFNQTISQLFLSEGESKIAGFGISMASILNIILDPIFVFPLGMGIAGAALATAVSNYVAFVYYFYHWFKRRRTTVICLDIRKYRARDGICLKVLAVGFPSGLVPLLTNMCDMVRNSYVAKLGSDLDLAGWGSVQKSMFALSLIALGIAQGCRPVISYNYARGDLRRTRKLASGSLITIVTYVIVVIALLNLFPSTVVKLFVTDPQAVASGTYFMRVWSLSLFGMSLIEVVNAIFQALGRWKLSMANTIINKGLLMTPILILLANLFGLKAVPISQIITDTTTAIVLLVIFAATTRWKDAPAPEADLKPSR
ncbi:MAG: MATE family efflux transporter [Oscillospiraceae bacterium]